MNNPRILLTIDGSAQTSDTAYYVSNLLSSLKIEVCLLHILRKLSETFLDIGIRNRYHPNIPNIADMNMARRKEAEEFMKHTCQIFMRAGFPEAFIHEHIRELKVGVARDILEEADRGYDAVIVGRKGIGNLSDLILGSVAHKLLDKLENVPLWVIDGRPETSKVLIAYDDSEGALKAVDYVGATLKNSNSLVTLFHVIRNLPVVPEYDVEFFYDEQTKWFHEAASKMEKVLQKTANRLVESGMHRERIETKVRTGMGSRAGAIVDEAKLGGYGTIVLGRRGLSRVPEFFMGRVSNKVIHMAKEKAVWIIS